MTELLEEDRVAPQNPDYRLVDEDDLVVGAEIFMVDADDPTQIDDPYQMIRLDDNPVREKEQGPYVYYHCIVPEWEGQCFVPLEDFLGRETRADTFYWLPR